jgi:hypothetical protein
MRNTAQTWTHVIALTSQVSANALITNFTQISFIPDLILNVRLVYWQLFLWGPYSPKDTVIFKLLYFFVQVMKVNM